MNKEEKTKLLYCSFCKKSNKEVAKLIAGPHVNICNSCVEVCREMLINNYPSYKELEEVQELELPKGVMKVSDIIALVAPYHFNTRIKFKSDT